jgi:hypothetical protein
MGCVKAKQKPKRDLNPQQSSEPEVNPKPIPQPIEPEEPSISQISVHYNN